MAEQPKIPPKVKLFMEIFEKMGAIFVDKDGNPIKVSEIEKNAKPAKNSIMVEKTENLTER